MQLNLLTLLLSLSLASAGCIDSTAAPAETEVSTVGEPATISAADAVVDKDVPYVPTPYEVVDRMLQMARVSDRDLLYDLGSGDGRIVITAARDYGARGIGIDIDPERIAEANRNAEAAKVTDRVRFIEGDLFRTDLRPATALTLYLLPSVNMRLRPKILAELRPGTPVVSHDFDMGDWKADEYVEMETHRLYLWIVPANIRGSWSWREDGEMRSVELEQAFQNFQGTSEGATISEATLRGSEIGFTITDGNGTKRRYAGRVGGDTIDGTITAGSARQPWNARRRN